MSIRPIALLIPGQGAQHPRMAAGLYGHIDVFTETMDQAFEILGAEGSEIREDWLSETPSPSFDDVTVAQPLLYTLGCALGRTVLSWGVEPAALLGHSVGEMVAATLAGVFDFGDGVRLMAARMKEFADTPPGGMLAVAASVAELDPFLSAEVFVAAVNAPRQVLLSGRTEPLADAARTLRAGRFVCKEVPARQAFHSPVVSAAAASSGFAFADVALKPPELTVYSAYTEGRLTAGKACDQAFWADQPAGTVLFASTLDRLLADGDFLLVEAGPGQGLTMLARRHPAVISGRSQVVALLPERGKGDAADRAAVQNAAARILRP